MPTWFTAKRRGKPKDEKQLVLLTLAVLSGADVDLSRRALLMRNVEDFPLPGRSARLRGNLNPFFSVAGCVLDHELTIEQVGDVEKVARQQYWDWDMTKAEMASKFVNGGRDGYY